MVESALTLPSRNPTLGTELHFQGREYDATFGHTAICICIAFENEGTVFTDGVHGMVDPTVSRRWDRKVRQSGTLTVEPF